MEAKVKNQNLDEILAKVPRKAQEAILAEAMIRAKQIHQVRNTAYRKFQQTYRNDYLACANDIFDFGENGKLTEYQSEIISKFNTIDRQAIRGPRTLGKTSMASILLLTFALLNDGEDWKIPTAASHWRQLEQFFWPEVHKWAGKIKWNKVGRESFNTRLELQTMKLKLQTGHAFAMSSDNPETLEGAHADHILVIFDESKIIPIEIWDSIEGSLAGGHKTAKFLAISTPGAPIGRFYDIHQQRAKYDEWRAVHITKERAIASGRMDQGWADRKKRQWGEKSALYQQHVLGKFASAQEGGIIPLEWVEAAMVRGDEWREKLAEGHPIGQMTSVGADIGLGTENNDDTVIAKIYDEVNVGDLEVSQPGNIDTATMKTSGILAGLIRGYNVDVYIDTVGIGLGSYNRLKELDDIKHKAHAFNAATKPSPKLRDKTKQYKFTNLRAAMWWKGRELLDPDNPDPVSLPRDDELMGQLTAPTKVLKSNAVMFVESKKELRKRIGGSTDKADPVLQALVGQELAKKASTQVYVIGKGYITK